MNKPFSSPLSVINTLDKGSVRDTNPFFVCRKDKTIPFMTFEIKDKNIHITMHCCNSAHTTTDVYQTRGVKSNHRLSKTPEKSNKCNGREEEDVGGSCEKVQQCLNLRRVKGRCFSDHNIQRDEDEFVRVSYFCKHHRNFNLGLYCNTCQRNICSECKWNIHQKHATFNVTDLLQNTTIQEWIANIPQFEKVYYQASKRCKEEQKQFTSDYKIGIRINTVLFSIVKNCLSMFIRFKESYDINLYRNTANIVNNFNFNFWNGLSNWILHNANGLNTAPDIDNFSTQLILDITKIQLPNPSSNAVPVFQASDQPQEIVPRTVEQRDTPFEVLTMLELPGKVFSLCKLNDSQIAVGCSDPHDIFIVDVNTLRILRTWQHHTGSAWRLYVHKRSGNLLSLSLDFSICIWDYTSGNWIKEIKEHPGCVRGLVEWNNGDIVTVCWGGQIKYFDMTEYKCYRTIENGLSWDDVVVKDNKWITGGCDGIKYFKEDAITKDDYIYKRKEGKGVYSLWLVKDWWWAGCSGSIQIYDVNSFELQQDLKSQSFGVNILILLCNGCVASGASSSQLLIWDWEAIECLQTLKMGSAIFTGWCEWDENSLICGSCDDKAIKIIVRK